MLAMMVDLEDDPEWSISDELDDEDSERYLLFVFSSFKVTCKVRVKLMGT